MSDEHVVAHVAAWLCEKKLEDLDLRTRIWLRELRECEELLKVTDDALKTVLRDHWLARINTELVKLREYQEEIDKLRTGG